MANILWRIIKTSEPNLDKRSLERELDQMIDKGLNHLLRLANISNNDELQVFSPKQNTYVDTWSKIPLSTEHVQIPPGQPKELNWVKMPLSYVILRITSCG